MSVVANRSHVNRREVVRSLAGSPAFGSCTVGSLEALVRISRRFTAPASWPLFAEGTPADCIYWIERGRATAYRGRKPLAEFGPGRVIDDPAVLTGRPRHITVTSSTRLAGLRVPSEAIIDLITRHPALLDGLLPDPCGPAAQPATQTPRMPPASLTWEPIRWRPPPAPGNDPRDG